MMVAAYFLVFDVVFSMRLGDKSPTARVGAFLIVGSLPWMAFCDAISRSMNSLLDVGTLLQKNALPTALFPAKAVLASGVIYFPLILMLVILYSPMHRYSLAVFAIIFLLLAQILLTFLLGYLLAILSAALRDVLQIVGFFLSVGIFASPVLFPISMFPEKWQWILWLNPATPLVIGYQSVLLQGIFPSFQSWIFIILWLLITAVALNSVLRRSREQLVDWL
jgi:lipopolysaccharide transport system permease protein